MTRITFISALLGVFCVLAPASRGQVQRVQDGQALDANPQIGRGGYNTAASVAGPINSQLYVTGQVTGLGAFRGRTGYYGQNQLHLDVPSARLSDFRRQSVGLQQVLAGQPYLASPYLDRTRTAMKVDDMLAGRAAVGSSMPATALPSSSAVGQELYINALTDYQALGSPLTGQTIVPERPGTTRSRTYAGASAGRYALGGSVGPWAAAAGRAAAMPSLPAGRTVFALSRQQDQAELARELYFEAMKAGMIDAQVDTTVPAAVDADAAGGALLPTDEAAITPIGTALGRPAPNRDAFMDMLWQLEALRAYRRAAATQPVGAAALTAPGSRLVEMGPDERLVLRELAGESRDLFNITMTRAGKEYRAGRYYDAASLYETAGFVDVRNPLARIGMGLSLLQAGESRTAAGEIQQAVRLFPPLVRLRVDLGHLVGDKALAMQAQRIEDRIRRADPETRSMLQFLAMFLYYNSGQAERAQPYAEKVRDLFGPGNALRVYADTVLKAAKSKPEPKKPAAPKDNPSGTGLPTAP